MRTIMFVLLNFNPVNHKKNAECAKSVMGSFETKSKKDIRNLCALQD